MRRAVPQVVQRRARGGAALARGARARRAAAGAGARARAARAPARPLRQPRAAAARRPAPAQGESLGPRVRRIEMSTAAMVAKVESLRQVHTSKKIFKILPK